MDLSNQQRTMVLGAALFVLALLAYANSFPGDFIIDDVLIVAENPLVESMDLRTIFTTDYWGKGAAQSVLYRPLTILSFAVNKRLLGPDPWSYHLVNVILHALVGVVFFRLLLRWGVSSAQAFLSAALFAVHPIHTEVLNEVIGRAELLAALFYLAALYLAASDRPWSLAGAWCCFLPALLAKEHAVTFLPAVVISDLYFRRRIRSRLPLYVALTALVVAWLLYRQFGLSDLRDPAVLSIRDDAIYQPLGLLPTPIRILTALKIQLFYLGKLLLPINLQAVYSGSGISAPVVTLLSGWGALIGTVGTVLAALVLYGWRQRRFFGLAASLYVVCFAVTANIFFVSGVVMAERTAYLPSAWFCLLAVTLLPDPWWKAGEGRRPLSVLLAFLLLGAGTITWVRNYDFGDQVRLWSKDFARERGNTLAGIYLVDAYVRREEYGKAAEVGEQVLADQSDLRDTLLLDNLKLQAWLLVMDGRPDEAVAYAERALRHSGEAPDNDLLAILVEINVRLDRSAEVIKWSDRIDPSDRDSSYWQMKGDAYTKLGDQERARDAYSRSSGH